MRRKITGLIVAVAALGALGAVATANSSGTSAPAGGSRMDDGAQLLEQATITEQQAITAAQTAATGGLDEVDLERYAGKLVFNVDVGASDVKVDADSGKVLDVSKGD